MSPLNRAGWTSVEHTEPPRRVEKDSPAALRSTEIEAACALPADSKAHSARIRSGRAGGSASGVHDRSGISGPVASPGRASRCRTSSETGLTSAHVTPRLSRNAPKHCDCKPPGGREAVPRRDRALALPIEEGL
jgi:hypothetical protein